MNISLFNLLHQRKLIHTSTCSDLSFSKNKCIYLGIDATRSSLHIGHLIPLNIMRLFKKNGYTIIVILGSATTLIGDPSWKNEARPMLARDEVDKNLKSLTRQIISLINPDHILYNHDWLGDLSVIDFVRDIGRNFSVNQLIKLETFAKRLESNSSLSFLELTYPLMQGYDFLYLHRKYNCGFQLGASDQWGNIVQGINLVRRMENTEVHGIVCSLLTNPNGEKMGKSVTGAVFLDKYLVSPYEFWQFWRNIDDVLVKDFLLQLTDIDSDLIDEMFINSNDINQTKKLLADHVTSWVHGSDAAIESREKAEAIFEKGIFVDQKFIDSNKSLLIDVVQELGFGESRSDAKRLIRNGSVKIDENRVSDIHFRLCEGRYTICIAKKHRYILNVQH